MEKKKIDSLSYTIFDSNATFSGLLEVDDPLFLKGNFSGNIRSTNTVKVGATATVKANIQAKNIISHGEIRGNLYAKVNVQLKEGSKLYGNIQSPKLEIDEGVLFEGNCDMSSLDLNANKT